MTSTLSTLIWWAIKRKVSFIIRQTLILMVKKHTRTHICIETRWDYLLDGRYLWIYKILKCANMSTIRIMYKNIGRKLYKIEHSYYWYLIVSRIRHYLILPSTNVFILRYWSALFVLLRYFYSTEESLYL